MKKFITKIAELYAPFRRRLAISFALLMALEAVSLITPYVYGKIINAASSKVASGVILFVLGWLMVMTTARIIDWVRDKLTVVLDLDINLHTAQVTTGKLLGFSVGQHHNENSGIKQQVINRGLNSIQQATSRILYELAPTVINLLVTFIILMFYNPLVGLITFLGIFIYLGKVIRSQKRFVPNIKIARKLNRRAGKVNGEIVRGAETIKLNAGEDRAKAEYKKVLEEGNKAELVAWMPVIVYWFTSGIIIMITGALVYLVSGLMVTAGTINIGQMVATVGWASPMLWKIMSAGNIQRSMMSWYADIDRYFQMMNMPCEIEIIENPVRPEKYQGEIRFENVDFTYPKRRIISTDDDDEPQKKSAENAEPAINNLSLTLRAGKRYAIVGESGSGKSTLRHLMLRSYDPQKGRILVDGIDLRTLDLRHYLDHVGVVEQDTSLFDRSLRENIVWTRPERFEPLTEERLMHICQQACIHKFMDRLENGLDTEIGERGVKLSGGERQRVGIARALAKDPSIMIFDEATSHLDSVNETDITEAIEEASTGRTTIVIAHRLSTILSADEILVMDKGQLVGMGTHTELYESCPKYQELVGNQIKALEKLHDRIK